MTNFGVFAVFAPTNKTRCFLREEGSYLNDPGNFYLTVDSLSLSLSRNKQQVTIKVDGISSTFLDESHTSYIRR